ncbi:hypothetical protein N431DRAFT_343131 [Stipitochalara longipes BDJ]|nr:hypothetical protein N431DRAFT_343131 [Stipitochalara longipes BDJ]
MWYPEDNPYAPSYAYAKEDVLQFAMSDAASLHVFITHVAMSLSTQADPKLARDASYHYSRAIGEVNRRIESSKDEEIPNATVFAVGCLVHAEITSNSVDRLNMHVNGLEALVNTKGGIQALSADSFTYKFTRWIDNICAIAMGSKPRFGGNDTGPYPDPAGWKTSSDIGLRYKIRLSNLTGLDDLAEETIEIYHILRHLIAAIHHSHLRISKDDFEVYSEQLTRRLLNIVQNKALEPPNPNALIFRLFGYAALAHVTNFICTPARRGSVLELMSIRLRESLEITNIRSFQIAYPEMMLWIIMVGGLAANGTPNHEWFAALLSESCLAAGVNKITELGLLLSEFLWSESYLHPVCKNFWDDVATAQAMGVSRESGSGSGIG